MARTVLLIEDDPMYASLSTLLLEGAGCTVLWASKGAEGIRVAREQQPDLVLLDTNLPGMDGFRIVALLKGDPLTRHIRVVGLTAAHLSGETERARARALGFDDYVEKPINKRGFAAVFGPLLDSAGGST